MKIANVVNKISFLQIPALRTYIELKDTKVQCNRTEGVIDYLRELTQEKIVSGYYKVNYYAKVSRSGRVRYDTTIEPTVFSRLPVRFVEIVTTDGDQSCLHYVSVNEFYKPVRFNKV